jgi:hypothetical protein
VVNDALFRVEFDVLEEQELQNRCILRLCIYKHVADSPRVRKRMRPVTPCVPVRRDGRYSFFGYHSDHSRPFRNSSIHAS